MPQPLCKNFVHLIFSTKNREPFFKEDIRAEMYLYLGGILRSWDSPSVVIGGIEDHTHILFLLSKNHVLKKIVEEVKSSSSKWLKTKGPTFSNFYWQNGYGAFSVNQPNVESVRAYIAKQEDHHRRMSFQEEFREFLRRYEVEYNERYVWD